MIVGLRVLLQWKIYRPDSVITAVMRLLSFNRLLALTSTIRDVPLLQPNRSKTRRRLRFSLRSLLLLVTVVAALAAMHVHRKSQHALLMTRCSQFYDAFSKDDMATAYQFMSPKYKKLQSLEEFTDDTGFANLSCKIPVISLSLTGNSASLFEYECGAFNLYSGIVHYWKRSDGKWYFTGDTDWFLD